MQRPRKKTLKLIIILLIAIVLISFSFIFWYFTVSPVCSLSTYGFSRPKVTKTFNSTVLVYFGSIFYKEQDLYNKSRPIDHSINLSINVEVTKGGPIETTIYIRNTIVFNARTNATTKKIICNSTTYNSSNPTPGIFPNINSTVPTSWLDAFTGGTTPYMVIKNLNTTSTANVGYLYSYRSLYRSSNGITLLMFIIGAIILIVEGIILLKATIRRVRGR